MLAPVKWDECKLFVEYGPGVGTFCQPVLDRMRPDATLLVIDTNPDFIEFLRKHFRDSRFIAVHGSAADVNDIIRGFGFEHADYVLSGLPFSTLPGDLGPKIAEETGKAIRPGGAFLVYQFRARARDFMEPHFKRIDNGYEFWNILPCYLVLGLERLSLRSRQALLQHLGDAQRNAPPDIIVDAVDQQIGKRPAQPIEP
jgi:phosphatidylethanolamine/phosphatidyl-N-methylethanolamine N-methyltransferase